MVFQTVYLFKLEHLPEFYGFVIFGTLCSYNFHWFLTPEHIEGPPSPKTRWSQINRKLHLIIAVVSLALSVWLFTLLLEHLWWLALSAVFTFLYSAPKLSFGIFNHLKKVAYGKTIFLALAWTHVTVMLPMLIADVQWDIPHYLFSINRFFFIYAICILFDLRDRENDKKEGIRSLITYFSPAQIDVLFWWVLVVFGITTLWLSFYVSLGVILALLIPAFILAFFYNWFKRHRSDYVYYFILDGLMIFSLPLLLLFQF